MFFGSSDVLIDQSDTLIRGILGMFCPSYLKLGLSPRIRQHTVWRTPARLRNHEHNWELMSLFPAQ